MFKNVTWVVKATTKANLILSITQEGKQTWGFRSLWIRLFSRRILRPDAVAWYKYEYYHVEFI